MKKLYIVMILLLSVTMWGCTDKKESKDSVNTPNKIENTVSTPSADRYDITKASYTEQNIKIKYPQLSNLHDENRQKKINELIKTAALMVLDDYRDDIRNLDLNMDYQIKYQGTGFLSIEYLGLAMVKDAAYPVHLLQTTNIDISKEKQLALSDVVTINDSFVKKFTAGQYKAYGSDLNLNSAGMLKEVLSGFSSQDLMESFKQPTARFYLTQDALGVSIEVPHAVGDHLEMEMAYKDLSGLLSIKP
ncbi:MAG TPA: hypothetical protein VN426_14650 [Syntrophomonadaceae bacterium]|nr:hypothetical protein [Syntrophomonadaceae bacterium]